MAQQTAVEILKKQLRDSIYHIVDNDDFYWFDSLFEQAKEMEKQQIINAHLTGLIHPLEIEATIQAEQYYNENYGK